MEEFDQELFEVAELKGVVDRFRCEPSLTSIPLKHIKEDSQVLHTWLKANPNFDIAKGNLMRVDRIGLITTTIQEKIAQIENQKADIKRKEKHIEFLETEIEMLNEQREKLEQKKEPKQ